MLSGVGLRKTRTESSISVEPGFAIRNYCSSARSKNKESEIVIEHDCCRSIAPHYTSRSLFQKEWRARFSIQTRNDFFSPPPVQAEFRARQWSKMSVIRLHLSERFNSNGNGASTPNPTMQTSRDALRELPLLSKVEGNGLADYAPTCHRNRWGCRKSP